MKKASLKNDPVTKSDLREELRRFATKANLLDLEEKFENKVMEFKDEVLRGVDAVMKEILAMREEQTVHSDQHVRINDELENHEERIEKLEKHAFA